MGFCDIDFEEARAGPRHFLDHVFPRAGERWNAPAVSSLSRRAMAFDRRVASVYPGAARFFEEAGRAPQCRPVTAEIVPNSCKMGRNGLYGFF